VILAVVFIDLKLVGRQSHIISFREAIIWTFIWVFLAFCFYVFLLYRGDLIHRILTIDDLRLILGRYHQHISIDGLSVDQAFDLYRKNLALEYITGYLIEYSLSVDNVFVIIMIFIAFGILHKYYKRVLFWGILGAIVMRFLFIFLGAALINKFEWVLMIFGAFLVYTGVQMFISRNEVKEINTRHHPIVKFASKHFAIYPRLVRHHFVIRKEGKLFITPLLIVLLIIEFSDVIFAVDSVPAIFSVTKDPYIVFFSNIFAILGLRSLFFLLTNIMNRFHYLKHGLSVLLTFIGLKMIINYLAELIFHYKKQVITTSQSLYIIIFILAVSIIASLLKPKNIKEL
jgi:tellurite resistance protein TerC